jgi:hypothetical protein
LFGHKKGTVVNMKSLSQDKLDMKFSQIIVRVDSAEAFHFGRHILPSTPTVEA